MWKKNTLLIGLIVLAIVIKIFSLFPAAVEKYYANGLYPAIASFQRILFGWIPFSIGDIFYAVLILLLLYKLTNLVKRLVKRKTGKAYWVNGLRQFVLVVLLVYVAFNGL